MGVSEQHDDLAEVVPAFEPSKSLAEIIEREARYNIAPSQTMPIVTAKDVHLAQWGFVPSWTTGKPKMRPINAKSETIATSEMFRRAFQARELARPVLGQNRAQADDVFDAVRNGHVELD